MTPTNDQPLTEQSFHDFMELYEQRLREDFATKEDFSQFMSRLDGYHNEVKQWRDEQAVHVTQLLRVREVLVDKTIATESELAIV